MILNAAIAAADPHQAVKTSVRRLDVLRDAERLHLLAIGKAAAAMAAAALDSLPRAPASTLVVLPRDADPGQFPPETANAATLRVLRAAHPVPDASSERAAIQIERQLTGMDSSDTVLVLISGGASSLSAAPAHGVGIGEYAATVHMLMRAGADIRELNTVRTHIDRLKGGGMAQIVSPARAIGLIVSDVAGNPLDVIASGPLTQCASRPIDGLRILEKYELLATAPDSVRRALAADRTLSHEFSHVTTHVVLDNRAAVEGAAGKARRLGYDTRTHFDPVTGSARAAGIRLARRSIALSRLMRRGDTPVCLLYGGETTVAVTGSGMGGRNQELALAAAIELDGEPCITVGSVGTDGIDGPTDAAGAVAGTSTVVNGSRAGVNARDALHENDSYTFFDAAGGLIRTGATGTNVMDVQVVLIDPPDPS